MTIAITGSTGFVGRHTVRALLERGHAVRALVRSRDKAADVLPAPTDTDGRLQVVEGDIFNESSLHDLTAGADALVHCIGIRIERGGVTYERMHTGATRAAVDACHASGTDRFVLVSALGTRANAPTPYWRTKWDSELLLRQSGLDWTIVRPSLVHGPDGELMQMIKAWSLGRDAPYFFMPYFSRPQGSLVQFPPRPPRFESARIAPVAVEDVAQCIAAALETADAVGETYPLCGPEDTDWPEMLRHMTKSIPMGSPRKPILGLPGHVGYGMATAAGAIGLGSAIPFGPSESIMAMEDMTCNTEKARAHLGFDPAPFFERAAAYADQI